MLVHVKILSLWEIAHYWHDYDPRSSETNNIPLKARDTLLVLAKASIISAKFSVYTEKHRAYLLKLLRPIQQIATTCFFENLQKSIDKKVFEKRLFNSMLLSRNDLARWCIDNKEPLPEFWFPDNDKYPYDLGDDEIEDTERYEYLLVYDGARRASLKPATKQAVVVSVVSNATKAANAKHAATNAINSKFITFYQEKGTQHPSKAAAARHFFDSLVEKEQLQFNSRDTATRTFLGALRKHTKKNKSP